ncbi:MAG: hypothetical protein KF690_02435 [Bacteroidetes bacterium]|nr:hypothetical protein [Bacteroidota bacterium]
MKGIYLLVLWGMLATGLQAQPAATAPEPDTTANITVPETVIIDESPWTEHIICYLPVVTLEEIVLLSRSSSYFRHQRRFYTVATEKGIKRRAEILSALWTTRMDTQDLLMFRH